MRVVFDTNVIIAGIVARGLCHEIVSQHLPQHEAILSRPLWTELTGKLREKFHLSPARLPVLALYRKHAVWVQARALDKPACRDPDDDWVLATALAGDAEVIVTGDPDLLDMIAWQGIRIETPRRWISG